MSHLHLNRSPSQTLHRLKALPFLELALAPGRFGHHRCPAICVLIRMLQLADTLHV